MEAMLLSRERLKQLLQSVYSHCSKCDETRAEELIVLSCIHVVCKRCAGAALQRAHKAQDLPAALQPTKYHDPRRFECPVCTWPLYEPLGTENFEAYLKKLPLHVDLEAVDELAPSADPQVNVRTPLTKNAPLKALPKGYETRQGCYVLDQVIGDYGDNVDNGYMRKVTGLAVNEYFQGSPLVVVTETKANCILSFSLDGKLLQALRVKEKLRDLCIGPVGTVIAVVAEEDYALAKWDSCLYPGGCRHENIFRSIFGHTAQINSEPFGVALDSRGRFLVTMLAKDRVCRWDERNVGNNIFWYGDGGQGRMKFNGAYYVAKTSDGLTVLSCTNDHKVKVIDEGQEELVREFGGLGSDLPNLCYPHGVCVDSLDNIYIADTGNFRVVCYAKDGSFVGCAVSETWNFGHDVKPTHVAVMTNGRLLVALQGRQYCRVHVYRPSSSSIFRLLSLGRQRRRREGSDGDDDDDDDDSCCCWKCWTWCCCCCCPSRRGEYEVLH